MPPSAQRLDRASPLPLWAQLLDDLRRRLEAGEFDERFPSELQLVGEYGVSRNTVREVLRRLRTEGTVLAARGKRPQLNRAIRQPLGAFYSLYESIEAAGLPEHSIVSSVIVRSDARVSRHLQLPADARVVRIERVRFAGDEPLATDRAYLPAHLASPLLEADLSSGSLYEHLAERAGLHVTGAEEVLSATVATSRQARELHVGPGEPLLSIERLGRAGGQPVEWRRTLIRADRFVLVTQFSLEQRPEAPYSVRLTRT